MLILKNINPSGMTIA